MPPKLTRRQTLAGAASVSLSSLLAGCGSGDESASQLTTTTGAATTARPREARPETAALFDDRSSCTLTAGQTEGPYYFDAEAIRSDVREDREGVPLRLAVRVRDAASCRPLRDAVVDVWHCDAGGVYSGFEAGEGQRFLRGAQVTNADGIAEFLTIYPGAYPGRTVHVHAKVHLDRRTVLTTQLYFDDVFSDRVFAAPAYGTAREREVRNDQDGLFDERLLLRLRQTGEGALGAISLDVRRA